MPGRWPVWNFDLGKALDGLAEVRDGAGGAAAGGSEGAPQRVLARARRFGRGRLLRGRRLHLLEDGLDGRGSRRGVAPALGREPGEGGELVAGGVEALGPAAKRGIDFLRRKALALAGVNALKDFVLEANHGLVF